jgi:hypothetical protein
MRELGRDKTIFDPGCLSANQGHSLYLRIGTTDHALQDRITHHCGGIEPGTKTWESKQELRQN